MKKIGILTQPLHQNYGGLLQAYALSSVLIKLGYSPYILDQHHKSFNRTALRTIISHSKTLVLKLLGRPRPFTYIPSSVEKDLIARNTNYFISQYIPGRSLKIHSSDELVKVVNSQDFYAYIVGSDQVWRPKYSPHLPNYFLDFLRNDKKSIKLSYAASFGVADWEYTKEQEIMARNLIKLFNAVSVREDSGVSLCKKYFNRDAIHVLDPTMLLSKDDYIKLIEAEHEPISDGKLFTYVLDKNREKESFIEDASTQLGLKRFEVMPRKVQSRKNIKQNIDDCTYPTVTKWLRAFMDAEFVITDSFHGCVFSILFNKPFIALGNNRRGLTRFQSLLKMFDLEDRLNSNNLKTKIDWQQVNKNLDRLRANSYDFLNKNLDEQS